MPAIDEPALLEGDVLGRRLQHVGGDAAALVDQPVGGGDDRRAASCAEREPNVPIPIVTRSLSP